MKKVPMCVMACVCVSAESLCVCKQDPEVCQGSGEGTCSLSAAGGSTGLVEAHGFAQPAGKVHFLHF